MWRRQPADAGAAHGAQAAVKNTLVFQQFERDFNKFLFRFRTTSFLFCWVSFNHWFTRFPVMSGWSVQSICIWLILAVIILLLQISITLINIRYESQARFPRVPLSLLSSIGR